jgi:formylmethanofuran dehydrogenase subunit A
MIAVELFVVDEVRQAARGDDADAHIVGPGLDASRSTRPNSMQRAIDGCVGG